MSAKPTHRAGTARIVNTAPSRARARVAVATKKIYWGAWIGSQLTGQQPPWDMTAVSAFETLTGKAASIISFASPFSNCSTTPCSFYGFPTAPLDNIRAHGSIPLLSWSSQSTPSSVNEPNYRLADLISGRYDAYIRTFAQSAKAWGHPFFLRFNWEMNGNWFPWSEGVNGNTPGQYVAAWRHVHDLFKSVGATNVSWVWCANVDPNNDWTKLSGLYPGDSYVDWTSLDGYNWGASHGPSGWLTFDQTFASTYKTIAGTLAPSKPMVISEVASTEHGGSKAGWIANMLSVLPTSYPAVRGVVWFERLNDGDWPIETSTTAISAFANGIQNPVYTSNSYANLASGPIAAP